jgi:ABC-type molybdate transport system substrate-binding protein
VRRVQDSRFRRWDLLLAVAAVLWTLGLWVVHERPWQPTLVVWCGGSNYESQAELARDFGRQNHCKVLVVAAPVRYLMELTSRSRRADVIAGGGDDGWAYLQDKGLLARGPEFFAVDPYVILVPPNNQGEITSARDLAKGVYAAAALDAMRPEGKGIASLLQAIGNDVGEPSLGETYYFGIRKRVKCARLLPRALKRGDVFAAITRQSMSTLPEAKGLQVIAIEPRHMLHMDACRGVVAQAAGVLAGSRHRELADRYIEYLVSPKAQEVLGRHGYLPSETKDAQVFKPLMQVLVPRHPHPYENKLAEELMADRQWDEALRRWLILLHTHGPSPYDAKARYYAGYCALQLGLKNGAWEFWRRCVRDYPRKGLHEWGGPIFEFGLKSYSPQDLDEEQWAEKASQALAELGEQPAPYGADRPTGAVEDALVTYVPAEIRATEADLPDGSRTNMALAEDELLCGVYDLALADYNKVHALNAPNEFQACALFRAGQCAWLNGNRAAAVDVWQMCNSVHAGKAWAELAGRMLYLVGSEGIAPKDEGLPAGAIQILEREIFETGLRTAQGLAADTAYWNFQTRHLSAALEECLKVIHAFYPPPKAGDGEGNEQPPDLRPLARYWAGIICCWQGHPDAAVYQWRVLARDYPNTEWSAKAEKSLSQLQAYPRLTAEQKRALQTARLQPVVKPAAIPLIMPTAPVPAGMDHDVWYARVALADLVPDKGQAAIWHHIALEQFVCRDWKAALCSFLKVLTVANVRNEGMNKWQDEALYFAGSCLERLGRPDRACARWQQLLELHPNSQWAAVARSRARMAPDRSGQGVTRHG